MTLDLSGYSPSGAEHRFRYIRFEPSNALSRNRAREQASKYVLINLDNTRFKLITKLED